METTDIALIAPCFNEGSVAVRFVQELASKLATTPHRWTLIMVDDASTDNTLELLNDIGALPTNVAIKVLSLPYNVGHQEAIHQGLLFAGTTRAQRFVVMDADGEDDPSAIEELLRNTDVSIVLVARGARSASIWFKLGYWCYRRLFRAVTGKTIAFGNFSMIDQRVLSVVQDRSFVHYSAFLSQQRVPTRIITYDRRERTGGRSKMDLRSLTMHAFKSLIEYSEEVLAFFLKAFLGLTVVFLLSIALIVCIKLFTSQAIPGWASTLSLSLFNSVLICLGFFAIGLLLVNTSHRRESVSRRLYRLEEPDHGPQ